MLLLACVTEAIGAEISTKSGDVLVGRINQDPLRFRVGGHFYTAALSDLREWRLQRLTFTDGSVLTAARFVDDALPMSTRFGTSRPSTDDIIAVSFDQPAGATLQKGALSDVQKESIKAISGLTLQFVVMAIGAFSLAGTFLVRRPGDVIRPWPSLVTCVALVALAASVIMGYLVHGAIIGQLEGQRFSAYTSTVRGMAYGQLILFVLGGLMFMAVAWYAARTQGIEFFLDGTAAERVTVLGTFNNWGNVASRARYRLYRRPWSRRWRIRLVLPPGTHEYLFFVESDDTPLWLTDPRCQIRVPNPFGGENCVVTVIGGKT